MEIKQSIWDTIDLSSMRGLARAISLVENNFEGASAWLSKLEIPNTPVIGITGPPGAGKSTLVSALLSHLLATGKKIGVIAVDPSSVFNPGALLGDRIRMSEHYLNRSVFIRSLATRGALGGLSAKAIEITDILKAAYFDFIIIETVGVGQSEVEIAGIADTTVVVLVPEAGDEIQALKSGIMEVAQIFVLNKSDRPGADEFSRNLRKLLHSRPDSEWKIPVIRTVASQNIGIDKLISAIEDHQKIKSNPKNKIALLAEKIYLLIQAERMKGYNKIMIEKEIAQQISEGNFNMYEFVKNKIK